MELTRKQELALIEIGLDTLLRGMRKATTETSGEVRIQVHKQPRSTSNDAPSKPKRRTMSMAARKKISRRMKKRWAEKRASE